MAEIVENHENEQNWKKYLDSYYQFVIKNPLIASEIESCLKWMSYFAAGRFRYSSVISELMFSAHNLLTLVNDTILRSALKFDSKVEPVVAKLKLCLSVIEYVEVFVEIVSINIGGSVLHWAIIFIIQLIKSAINLVLLLYYNQGITKCPPVPPFDRRKALPQLRGMRMAMDMTESKETFTLKRSKRILRSLEMATPLSLRTWKPPSNSQISSTHNCINPECAPTNLTGSRLVGEVVHITRPLSHLFAVAAFGKESWIPWITAFGMDLTSLKLIGNWKQMNYRERVELSRRTVILLLYVLRSPAYEKISKKRILYTLRLLADNVPLLGIIIRPLLEYLPEWQKIYFYTWSH